LKEKQEIHLHPFDFMKQKFQVVMPFKIHDNLKSMTSLKGSKVGFVVGVSYWWCLGQNMTCYKGVGEGRMSMIRIR